MLHSVLQLPGRPAGWPFEQGSIMVFAIPSRFIPEPAVSSDAGHTFGVSFPVYAIVNNKAEVAAGGEPVLTLVDEQDHGTCVPLFTDSGLAGQFPGDMGRTSRGQFVIPNAAALRKVLERYEPRGVR
jgi:hypothetical protein